MKVESKVEKIEAIIVLGAVCKSDANRPYIALLDSISRRQNSAVSAKAASGDSSHLVDTRKSKYTPEANIYCGAETETSSFLLPF